MPFKLLTRVKPRPLRGWLATAASGRYPPSRRLFANAAASAAAFRVTTISGKGFGLSAARDLKRGDLVISETPVLTYNAQADAPMKLDEVLAKQHAELSPGEQQDVLDLYDAHISDDGQKTLAGIVMSNAFSRESGTSIDAALCLVGSRLNHSCVPNVEQTWNADSAMLEVRASTDIAAGEELCNYYIDLLTPRGERLATLAERYHFQCTCGACASGPDLSGAEESDRRRRRLGKLVLAVGQGASSVSNAALGVMQVKEALALLNKEGLHLLCQRKVFCRTAFELSLGLGDLQAAKQWINLSFEASRACHGPDHRDTLWLERYVQTPHAHPAYRSLYNVVSEDPGRAAMTAGAVLLVIAGSAVLWSTKRFENE